MKDGSTIQPELDFQFTGEQLARAGMELAKETADKEFPGWSERCWQLFFQWLNKKPQYFEFQTEDFRAYLKQYDLLEKPKTDRAYGFIAGKAQRRNLIEHAGFEKVSDPNCHSRPSNLWRKK